MKHITKLIDEFNRFAVGMDSKDWAVAAVVLVVVGVVCMQGAKSKTNF